MRYFGLVSETVGIFLIGWKMAVEIDSENSHFWNFKSHVTLTLTSDDLESDIFVNDSSTVTNSTIWFVAALSLIVDVRTYVWTDGRTFLPGLLGHLWGDVLWGDDLKNKINKCTLKLSNYILFLLNPLIHRYIRLLVRNKFCLQRSSHSMFHCPDWHTTFIFVSIVESTLSLPLLCHWVRSHICIITSSLSSPRPSVGDTNNGVVVTHVTPDWVDVHKTTDRPTERPVAIVRLLPAAHENRQWRTHPACSRRPPLDTSPLTLTLITSSLPSPSTMTTKTHLPCIKPLSARNHAIRGKQVTVNRTYKLSCFTWT